MTFRLPQFSNTKLMVLYVVGATLEVMFAFPVLLHLFGRGPHLSNLQFEFLVVCTYSVGVFYCIFASFAFKPKRIFSPFPLQILVGSYVILADLVLWFLERANATANLHLISLMSVGGGRIFVTAFFLGMLALFQSFAVTDLVGLNGMESDVTCMGWRVNAKSDDVVKRIANDISLRRLLRVEEPKKQQGFEVLRSPSNETTQVIVMAAPNTKKSTEVVFLCYDKLSESIMRSPVADELSKMLKSRVRLIGKLSDLPKNNPTVALGMKLALRPTMPRVLAWTGTASRWKGVTIGIVGLVLISYFAWTWFGIGSEDFVLTMAGFAVLNLIWTLAPIVSERVS